MVTLLHHMQPWMQKYICEVEEQIEKRAAQQIEQKIKAVYQRLDAFELCVPSFPAPMIHLTTLQESVGCLHAYVDAILNLRGTKWENVPNKLVEDTVLDTLFKTSVEPKPEPHGQTKIHHSRCTTDAGDDPRVRKK